MRVQRLCDIVVGKSCLVHDICLNEAKTNRLWELGLIPGTHIRCEMLAPSGSPMAFWVNGALIALRRADCAGIGVVCCE